MRNSKFVTRIKQLQIVLDKASKENVQEVFQLKQSLVKECEEAFINTPDMAKTNLILTYEDIENTKADYEFHLRIKFRHLLEKETRNIHAENLMLILDEALSNLANIAANVLKKEIRQLRIDNAIEYSLYEHDERAILIAKKFMPKIEKEYNRILGKKIQPKFVEYIFTNIHFQLIKYDEILKDVNNELLTHHEFIEKVQIGLSEFQGIIDKAKENYKNSLSDNPKALDESQMTQIKRRDAEYSKWENQLYIDYLIEYYNLDNSQSRKKEIQFEDLFFNKENQDLVVRAFAKYKTRTRVTKLCLAMADALNAANFIKPNFSIDQIARAIGKEIFDTEFTTKRKLGDKERGISKSNPNPDNTYYDKYKEFYAFLRGNKQE